MSDPTEQFRRAMHQAGLDYAGPLNADGTLHRFKVEGDHEKNSWYVLHDGPPTAGAFGCWKRGSSETWCSRNGDLNKEEWNAVREQWRRADEERKRAEDVRHAEARTQSQKTLDDAQPPNPRHPYLVAKGVGIHGDLCQIGDGLRIHVGKKVLGDHPLLVLPLRDVAGKLHSLQAIRADGVKRFATGGRITGTFFTLADTPGPLVICEGYATGASIHEATGDAVVCAMNSGNLMAVAESIRAKYPEREIIIAGDNDQWTEGNPGVTKATEAAKSIGARLVIPHFKDTSTKPTDCNDLARLESGEAVKHLMESATAAKETDDETIARLAALSPLEYDRSRKAEAKQLGIRESILDRQVADARPKSESNELQGAAVMLADPEPWPDHVDGADVLNELAASLSRYVALPDGAADAIALWCAHTHCFQAFTCSPRLNVGSPEKGCGKSTLRDVVALFVPRPLMAENLSLAVLFRVIATHNPTLLIDEADSWLRDDDELRGMLNSGHRRGGQALRCEGDGNEVRAFPVFGPVVLCGIGALPGTLHDRSIVIRLERAKPGEVRERFDSRRTEREQEVTRKLARWCADHSVRLQKLDPSMPDNAHNRLADNWRPLFAIAQTVGGDWPARAVAAYDQLSKSDADAGGINAALLADIKIVFEASGMDRMFSSSLVKELVAMTDRPWPEAKKGHAISETWLARRLKGFNVQSRNVRIGDEQAKGYHLSDMQEAFDRYLPDQGLSKRPSVPKPANIDDSPLFKASQAKPVGRIENVTKPNKDGAWDVGTDGNPPAPGEEKGELL